jgi:NAD(P)-dependent dehydrogenase (short-subunit alcohol dehydrogenase family)
VRERGWALVTGAARRLGRVLALAAADAGYDILVHHRDSGADAAETADAVRRLGRAARVVAVDLDQPGSAGELFGAAPGLVTLLINNASRFEDDRVETLTAEGFDETIATNLRAPILLAQAFARTLPDDRQGLIVNIVDQRVWRLTPQFFSYTVSKSGLWAATQTMAQALAPRIRVNAIGPGPTLANEHQGAEGFAAEAGALPLGRSVAPDDIGHALRYLIDAVSVTGQMIAVDGGQHLAWRTPDVLGD